MALPLYGQVKIYDEIESGVGREAQIYINSKIDPGKPSLPATHLMSLNGSVAQAAQSADQFKRDGSSATAAVKTGRVSVQLVVGDIVKVGNIAYEIIANGASPVGHQIALGTTAALTATAIKNAVHADTANGVCCDAAVSTDIDTFTANTAGVDFDLWCSNPNYIITTTTANVANQGYIDILLKAKSGLAPTPKTSAKTTIGMTVNNIYSEVEFGAYVPDDAITLSDITDVMLAVLKAGLDGTDPATAGGYIEGLDTFTQTTTQLSAAMVSLFGSTASIAFRTFSIKEMADSVKIQLVTAGANCANVKARSEAGPSYVDDIPLNQFGQPTEPGWDHVGPASKFGNDAKTNTVKVQTGGSTAEQNFASTVSAGAKFGIFSQLTPEIISKLSRYKVAVSANRKQTMLGSANNVDINRGVAILITYQDKADTISYIKLHSCILAAYSQNLDIGAVPELAIDATAKPFPARVDKYGITGTQRIVA